MIKRDKIILNVVVEISQNDSHPSLTILTCHEAIFIV